LDEQRFNLKGIPVGSWVKPAMGAGMGRMLDTHGFTHAIAYINTICDLFIVVEMVHMKVTENLLMCLVGYNR